MTARKHERTLARQAALQVLYTAEMAEENVSTLEEEGAIIVEDGVYSAYARLLAEGVDEHLDEVDDLIADASDNWKLSRMPVVDRAILRLAIFEMLYVDAVPVSVSINEAVELAKSFGGEDNSPRFVNGVLGRIAKLCEERSAEAETIKTQSGDENAVEA